VAEIHSYDVAWSDVAAGDLEQIALFIAQRNPQNARAFSQKLRRRVAALAHTPFRNRLVPELKAIGLEVYRELIVEPYRVLLKVQGKNVYILGVFDGRRDLEEVLFERLTRL
jgi:toxin ParE1/3/4